MKQQIDIGKSRIRPIQFRREVLSMFGRNITFISLLAMAACATEVDLGDRLDALPSTSETDDSVGAAGQTTRCGDGVVQPELGEQCDDGNPGGKGSRCTADCRLIASVCGDGRIDLGEECDDGNAAGGDGCSAVCALEPRSTCPMAGAPCATVATCGDGVIQAGEQCDDGKNNGAYGVCGADCTIGPHCGDGIVQAGYEQCDDGKNEGGYGRCAPGCVLGPYCGDQIKAAGEECDEGANNGKGPCSVACRWVLTVCGDGMLDSGEACDDGNTLSGDGCSSACVVEAAWACPSPGYLCKSAP